MRYTYDCLLEWDDGWWLARFPQLGDFTTQGKTREEALSEASDLLVTLLADYAERGENPPACRRLVECVAVSVEVTQEDFDETRYETQTQAAERLGVSKSRISALVASGQLESRYFEGRRKVSIESVNRYAAGSRKAGRPKAND